MTTNHQAHSLHSISNFFSGCEKGKESFKRRPKVYRQLIFGLVCVSGWLSNITRNPKEFWYGMDGFFHFDAWYVLNWKFRRVDMKFDARKYSCHVRAVISGSLSPPPLTIHHSHFSTPHLNLIMLSVQQMLELKRPYPSLRLSPIFLQIRNFLDAINLQVTSWGLLWPGGVSNLVYLYF